MAKIGHATSNENGQVLGGRPGDQTGREVRINDFNDGQVWQILYRPINNAVAKAAAENMRQACNNNNIGYSTDLNARYTMYTEMKKVGKISAITVPCSTDCSQLVVSCFILAGLGLTQYMWTGNEEEVLMGSGQFQKLTDPQLLKGNGLKEGDVLWRKGHTAMVVEGSTNGSIVHNTTPRWVGAATGNIVVYSSASTSSSKLSAWPALGKDNLVDVCDEANGMYYIRIAGKYYGWVVKSGLVSTAAPQPSKPNQNPKWVAEIYGKNIVPVYSSPSTTSGKLSSWPQLAVTNKIDICDEDGAFYYVRIAGKYFGYVEKQYTLCVSTITTGTVLSPLNFREGPGVKNKSICVLPTGAMVQICDTKKAPDGVDWYYCVYNGKYGFSSSKYIKKK